MIEDNKQFMRRFVEEVINKKNLDALNELVAEDFVEHVPFPGQVPGREGLRHVLSTFVSAFPDIRWTLEEQIAQVFGKPNYHGYAESDAATRNDSKRKCVSAQKTILAIR